MSRVLLNINIDQPKYDQSTYIGRVKHFFLLTNPLNLLASHEELERARKIVTNYRTGRVVYNIQTIDEIWKAKYLYDSAFHPETGQKSILIGRMCAQVPMNTIITGCMLSFYKSPKAVIFWQWLNQTFNAIVNHTNRSGSSPISTETLIKSYCLATGGALVTALSLNRLVAQMRPLIGRLVPLTAVAAACCINIPMMRVHELTEGVALMNKQNEQVGLSRQAAVIGISTVVASRIAMAIPGMVLIPLIMDHLERKAFLRKFPKLGVPTQMLLCGFLLIFATPLGCAFFRQQAVIRVSSLEQEVQNEILQKYPHLKEVWYNKGL